MSKGVYYQELCRLVKEYSFFANAKVSMIDFDWCILLDLGDGYDIEIFPEHEISSTRRKYNEVSWRLYLWEKEGGWYHQVAWVLDSQFSSISDNIEALKKKKGEDISRKNENEVWQK